MGRIMTQGKHILGLFLEAGNAVSFQGDSGSYMGAQPQAWTLQPRLGGEA